MRRLKRRVHPRHEFCTAGMLSAGQIQHKRNCPSWRLPALILRRLSEAATGGKTKMADTDKIVEQLSSLSVLEIAGLVKQLEEKWGVSAAAPVAMAAAPAGGGAGAAAPAAEEKTTFDVILKEMGANKIGVIKEVRAAV